MDVAVSTAAWSLANSSVARANLRERARRLAEGSPHVAAEHLGGRPTRLRWSGLGQQVD